MKLIKASYEIVTPIQGEEILKQIELAGRVCYKSESKIEYEKDGILVNEFNLKDDIQYYIRDSNYKAKSARKLISNLIRDKHEAMLEFGGNITVKFICDRGVSHELVRHRIASFAQESTRYCNYGKDEHISFIIPSWLDINEGFYSYSDPNPFVTAGGDINKYGWDDYSPVTMQPFDENNKYEVKYNHTNSGYDIVTFIKLLHNCEESYNDLINSGRTPQQARSVLPNSLKTEINVSTNIREWRHIFKLRTANAAHPDMRYLMRPLLAEFQIRIPILFDDITY